MNFPFKKYLIDSRVYRAYKRSRAWFAHYYYGRPSDKMLVIGVTGTDGKTTTCNILHWILEQTGHKSLFVGTTGVLIGDQEMDGVAKMTSYDPIDLQAILSRARKEGCKYAILEVSSHGLQQLRFAGIKFQIGVLTNVTHEHLDYHGTYENYLAAKKKLFDYIAKYGARDRQIFLPDHQKDITDWMDEYSRLHTRYGLESSSHIYGDGISLGKNNTQFVCHRGNETIDIDIPMVGKFNVLNTLAAIGVAEYIGIDIGAIQNALKIFPGIKGRQQHFSIKGVDRYIDFAHTPQGLDSVLSYLKSIKGSGTLRCLFGAPGLRDTYKRPEMGRVVDELADNMVITDDDADTEDRFVIIDQIKAGVDRAEGDTYQIIPDRREAIQYVVDHVEEGDVVLLAGKGHEKILLTNNGKIPWSDVGVLYECLGVPIDDD